MFLERNKAVTDSWLTSRFQPLAQSRCPVIYVKIYTTYFVPYLIHMLIKQLQLKIVKNLNFTGLLFSKGMFNIYVYLRMKMQFALM